MKRILAVLFLVPLLLIGCGQDKQVAVLNNKVDVLTKENKDLQQKLDLYRSKDEETKTASSNSGGVEDEYIKHFLKVYDFKTGYYDAIGDGKVIGCLFKIKNTGNKTLSEIEATVYFKDKNNKNIGEEKYYPVIENNVMGMSELKPNYTYQIEGDQFYTAKSISKKEWKTGNAEIKITNIKFK